MPLFLLATHKRLVYGFHFENTVRASDNFFYLSSKYQSKPTATNVFGDQQNNLSLDYFKIYIKISILEKMR